MKLKDKPILLFIILFLGMEFFSYLCFSLLHIDYNTKNEFIRIIFDVLFMLIIIFLIYRNDLKEEGIRYIKNFKSNFFKVILIYILGLLIMYVSNNLIAYFFTEANPGNEEGVRKLINNYPIYMCFSTIIYAPFVEEIIFRKSIFNIFKKIDNKNIKKWLSIIVSGLIFGLLHVVGTANGIYDYLYIIPYASLGIALALMYYKTDSIFVPITIHAIHNLVAMILYFGVSSIL